MKFSNFSSFWTFGNKSLNNIIFYQNGEVIAQTKVGQLESIDNSTSSFYVIEIPEITKVNFLSEPNLDRKDCFVVNDELYIYGPIVNATKASEIIFGNADEKTSYITAFNLTFTYKGEVKTMRFFEKNSLRTVYDDNPQTNAVINIDNQEVYVPKAVADKFNLMQRKLKIVDDWINKLDPLVNGCGIEDEYYDLCSALYDADEKDE